MADQGYPTEPQPRLSRKNDELNIGEIYRLVARHKFLFSILIVSAVAAAVAAHIMYPSYKVGASIAVQVSDYNPLQQVSARLIGFGENVPKEMPEKYFTDLKSFNFYLAAAKVLKNSKEFQSVKKDFFEKKTPIDRWKSFIRKTFMPKAHPNDQIELSDERLASTLADWFGFTKIGSDTIATWVVSPDPDLSLLIVNIMTEEGVKFIIESDIKDLDDAERYVNIQLEQSEKSIRQTDLAVIDFKKKNHIMTGDFNQAEAAGRAVELKKELEEASIQLQENQKLIDSLKKNVKATDYGPSLAEGEPMSGSKPKFGLFRRVQELQRDNQYLSVRISILKRVMDGLNHSLDPSFEQKVFELRKRMELEYSLYQELKKQLFQIEMQRIVVRNKVRVFEKGHDFDIKRSLSLKKKLVFAILIALMVGGPSAYAWELIVPTIKKRQDLDDHGLLFLGNVPDLTRTSYRKRRSILSPNRIDDDHGTLCRFDIDSAASMSFKHVRTRIQHISEAASNSKLQIISIHSAQVGEGKSFISGNLAACLAHMKKKVLLIDCDLRKGTTSEFFKTRHLLGLSEVLGTEEKFGSVVRKGVLPNLDLLAAGRFNHDATEMIASPKFAEFLADLKTLYDFIVLDAPPLIAVPDSALIAKQSEMPIVVVSYNQTTHDSLERSIECIFSLGISKIYTILNRINTEHEYLYVVPDSFKNAARGSEKTITKPVI